MQICSCVTQQPHYICSDVMHEQRMNMHKHREVAATTKCNQRMQTSTEKSLQRRNAINGCRQAQRSRCSEEMQSTDAHKHREVAAATKCNGAAHLHLLFMALQLSSVNHVLALHSLDSLKTDPLLGSCEGCLLAVAGGELLHHGRSILAKL